MEDEEDVELFLNLAIGVLPDTETIMTLMDKLYG
jgi:hypothetical protein